MSGMKNLINKLFNIQRAICLAFISLFILLLLGFQVLDKYRDSNFVASPNWIGSSPVANIQIGEYSWKSPKYELSTIGFNSNITFSIEAIDALSPLKERYYYISNSSTALTEAEISAIDSWQSYSSDVVISEEGSYVIYVKVVENNDSVSYLNTDLLVLDLSGSSVIASVDDHNWSDLRASLNDLYIDKEKDVTIDTSDSVSGISSVKYYVSDQILNADALGELSSESWVTYSDGILIDDIGSHIVYVQVADNCGNITYINTDRIILGGYTANLTVGRNPSSYTNADLYITSKSAITLNSSYVNSSASDISEFTHNLISSILLPIGTNITLIDNVTNKVYEYQIATDTDIFNYNGSCDPEDLNCEKVATIPFSVFNEVGTGASNKTFVESNYYADGVISEDFTVVLDLSNTNISVNYENVSLYTELRDYNDAMIRPTLQSTIKKFNIYYNVDGENANASLSLSTNYDGHEILFNSNSSTNINITSKINYKYLDTFKITDTTYEDKKIGLSVKMVDSDGNIVDKEHLKNMIFMVGNNIYYPNMDNIIRIDLNNGIADTTKDLTVVTFSNNGNLEDGTYYIKVSNYASYDGVYDDQLGGTQLSIPVNVKNNGSSIAYGFGAIMNDINRIISKKANDVKVSFNILQNGNLKKPNIKVSLYKKDELTAYNQNYTIVDLSDYVSDTLNKAESNIYYVSTEPVQYTEPEHLYNGFELNLITANFENTGYKYVFDLYDDTKKIGTIEKYFIVKEE